MTRMSSTPGLQEPRYVEVRMLECQKIARVYNTGTVTWSGSCYCTVSICWENFQHDLNFSAVNIWTKWRNYPKSSSLSDVRANDKSSLFMPQSLKTVLDYTLKSAIGLETSPQRSRRLSPLSSWSPETRRCWHCIDSFSGGTHCGHSETVIRERQSSNWAWQTSCGIIFLKNVFYA